MKIIHISYISAMIAVFTRAYSYPPILDPITLRIFSKEANQISILFTIINILLILYLLLFKVTINFRVKNKISFIGLSFYLFTVLKTLFFTYAYVVMDRKFQFSGIVYSLILPIPLILISLDNFKISKLFFMRSLEIIFKLYTLISFYAYIYPDIFTKNISINRMNYYFPHSNFAAWFFSISALFFLNKIIFKNDSSSNFFNLFFYILSITYIISTGGRTAFALTLFLSLLLIIKRFPFRFNYFASLFSFSFLSIFIFLILFPNFSLIQFRVTNLTFASGRDQVVINMLNDFLNNPIFGTGMYKNTESSILLTLSVGGLLLFIPLTFFILNSFGKVIINFIKVKKEILLKNNDISFISVLILYFIFLSISEGSLVLDRFSINQILITFCFNRYVTFIEESRTSKSFA